MTMIMKMTFEVMVLKLTTLMTSIIMVWIMKITIKTDVGVSGNIY